MKTSKKILYVLYSLALTCVISAGISLGCTMLFSLPFWYTFWFFNSIQIGGYMLWDKYYETRNVIQSVREYASKPYKKYILGLNCSHCGISNELEIDLTDTEFRCENCKKYNGIHINFTTAAITEPIVHNV